MREDRRFWRSIRFKLVTVSLLLVLFSLELIGAYFVRTLTTSLVQSETQTVENQAHLMSILVAPQLEISNSSHNKHPLDTLTSMLSSLPQFMGGSVYILNRDGFVVDTSAGTALIGQQRTDSVSTEALLQHKTVAAIRFDPLSNQHLLTVAVPILYNNRFLGVVEYVVPIQSVYNTVHEVTKIFYTGSAIGLMLAALLGILLARTITRPILDATRQARVLASGDFSRRVHVGGDDEFGDLATAINDLTTKLEDALQTNQREQERLRAIITSMGDGVVAFNPEWQPLFLNEAARRMLQLRTNDSNAAIRLGLTEMKEDIREKIWVREIGQSILHVHVTALQQHQERQGYVAVIRDVTEQEKLIQAQRDFVANVSHELRTPLTSVKSYIEALRDLTPDEEDVRQDFLQVVSDETDRMVRLTRDLLLLSGLSKDSQRPRAVTYITMERLFAFAEQRFRIQANARELTFIVDPAPPATLLGDEDMLHRVLDNLLSNAFKYTPAGGIVCLSAHIENADEVEIIVSDTGIGIPPEDLPHVFERFYRVDKGRSRRSGGTGLGLALAREIVERHGGTIDMESEVNRGTKVHLRLPMVKDKGVGQYE
ncbi:ATP-binding protein [Alicyclobacillus tolerans]|uniref:histidine kinase n=1 Tax=Alicyclobacillus tolerans TaxID=90970 RepID=A0A1M6T1K2_9BACL|nr:ATP-binding protein [Alicyclobacillus montanus]SHK50844.1 two-component system, OmpR family, sensor histidine kinase VicK [Alicyclobacillus montanus]